jgi:alpha-glucosidase
MILLLCGANIVSGQQRKTHKIQSPDKTIELVVSVENEITYSVNVDGKTVVEPSQISMTVQNDQVLGKNPEVSEVKRSTVRQEIKPVIPEKFAVIEDHYNEMTIALKGKYSVIFRTYNNGVAYRSKRV